ncbi:oxygen-independent coproporphyrinogen III oxidase [Desertifilum sp. FACHB-1129]|uniref:Coproporphyrinogen-III oxidase n=1 Tax=Desertifilum tharense IPPAS B-1220 TaxID=1781255 RepID=A0A1E5QDI6_9CYAN|nr:MULTISPECIES: oxygen-independent coproporphyrinogen III oxidase [Desertifilum]MCD8489087.1 oxygen-independent coproporphyrinogen III oxidase [Desertifilum sp.]MDA0213694.1 oxygen-independent coproporphyrinogen III oxidase [Cyanobacteria bacterium FC1]MDI9639863.1 oxygen-independent coproporphyrinogen III oxidase [Geitlerinema splendidum]MBD2311304.1 oxygen-independent coproporphyrinogen III oxidase [Desertifilum sp. FACHB-1129]MBD2321550.1 oxygen-independent coproporphyrinogen III oxidase [
MKLLSQAVEFDFNLLRKYDRPVPRYTSYPPATELREEFAEIDFKAAIAVGNYKKTPLSLYCHIPFCETACYFCGCNTIITQRKALAEPYLEYLQRDIRQMASYIDRDRHVDQLHWGGGTPNYLSAQQVETLWETLNQHFTFAPDAEISIEVNPRFLERDYLFHLRDLGFNRISFGIQDFDPRVQAAVNRIQPEEMLFEAMGWIREAGFESVNVDLIYGLPYQSLETFKNTIHKTLKLEPDRIAVFNFAYVPWLKPIQRKIPQDALPAGQEKLDILQMTIAELTDNGYVFIGMDHFAKPNDELAIAQREGNLHRNFQGYTTKPESELFGFGMTSISMLHDVYVQNHKRLKSYYQAIDKGELPIERGVALSREDIIRRSIIMELMCQFQLCQNDIEEKYHLSFDLDFEGYFAQEKYDLRLLEADGLLHVYPHRIEVTPIGRLLIRNIASVFDTYLRHHQLDRFSKAV